MKTKITIFEILHTNVFGIGVETRKGKVFDTAEETFKNFLNSLPKRLSNSWQGIEFDFNGKNIDVSRHHLVDTNFDFNNSITIS